MSSRKSNQTLGKNELIFGNAPKDIPDHRSPERADERVDLEIILFGPKSRLLNNGAKLEPKRAYSTSYLKEFDPLAKDIGAETSSLGSSKSLKENSPRVVDGQPKSSSGKSNNSNKLARKQATDPLLEQMERMFREAGQSSAGNDAHIDYMDYF